MFMNNDILIDNIDKLIIEYIFLYVDIYILIFNEEIWLNL